MFQKISYPQTQFLILIKSEWLVTGNFLFKRDVDFDFKKNFLFEESFGYNL